MHTIPRPNFSAFFKYAAYAEKLRSQLAALTTGATTGVHGLLSASSATSTGYPDGSGPVTGPAPLEHTHRTTPITLVISRTDSQPDRTIRVQPWIHVAGSAIFIAYTHASSDTTGTYGVYNPDIRTIQLPTALPFTTDITGLEVPDTVHEQFRDEFRGLYQKRRFNEFYIQSGSVEPYVPEDDSDVCTGRGFTCRVNSYQSSHLLTVYPWRNRKGGAVYINWAVDGDSGRHGLKGLDLLRFGELGVSPHTATTTYHQVSLPDAALDILNPEIESLSTTDSVPTNSISDLDESDE